MKLRGIIQPTETQQIEAEGDDYTAAKLGLERLVPEGWRLIQITTDR